MALTGPLTAAGSAYAAEPTVSGFTDVQWLLTNEADEDQEGQFSVPQVEVDVETDNLYVAIAGSDSDSFGVG